MLAKAVVLFVLALVVWSSEPTLLKLVQFKVPEELERFVPKILTVGVWLFRYVFFILLTLVALVRLFSFFTLRVGLTDKRLLCDDALLGSFSLDLGKIESVKCEPGLFGGLFGYGKVILTAASSQRLVLTNLSRPHVLEQEIFAAK
ncbi:PH domain-containing protein [Desulfovibrio sp. DV]|uniref:PH domain-containing protein n=1 Tax=Desulfovibrio sp. DV TaxID=1844708 RepID=UPI0020C96B83|nr:PH domain-containing protein [Desulfovibrio sp. DV]